MPEKKQSEIRCTTCKVNVLSEDRFAQFKCPSCGKADIVRCEKCRKSSNVYVCPGCGFEGP